MTLVNAFFVYGTLKRTQCREKCWPSQPLSIRSAWIPGRLLDLDAYPGLIAPSSANEWVQGELWQLASSAIPSTLKVLDEIEGYSASRTASENLYVRIKNHARVIDPTQSGSDSKSIIAWTYFYNQESCAQSTSPLVPPRKQGSHWIYEWPSS